MGEHKYGPGGGAIPSRPDEKISHERQTIQFYDGPIKSPRHKRAWNRMLKRVMTKKRRQHDKIVSED